MEIDGPHVRDSEGEAVVGGVDGGAEVGINRVIGEIGGFGADFQAAAFGERERTA